MTRNSTLFASLLLLIAPAVSRGQAGAVDPSFNGGLPVQLAPGAIQDNINELVTLPDTTILFCGTTSVNGATRAVVGHLLQDGTLDQGFGTNGYTKILVGSSSFAYDMVLDAQGRIMVCGIVGDGSYYDVMVARLLQDGSFDTSFDGDGVLVYAAAASDDVAEGIALDGTKIVIGGSFKPQVGFSFKHTLLLRFNDDGSIDSTFGTAGMTTFTVSTSSDQVNDIAVLSDGSVVGAGYWNTSAMQDRGLLVKVDAAGQPDPTFGTNGVKQAIVGAFGSKGNTIMAEGLEFVVGGTMENTDTDVFLARFTALGAPVTAFGTAGKTVINYLALDGCNDMARTATGSYLLAGSTGGSSLTRDFWTIQCDVNGIVDPAFGTNGWVLQPVSGSGDFAQGVGVQPDGKIIVGGTGVFANNDMVVVRYLGDPIGTDVMATPDAVGFTTFPVPCDGGVLNVRLEGSTSTALLTLMDLHGRVLRRSMVSTPSGTVALDVSGLSAGTYVMELISGAGRTVRPVVIAH